MHGAKCLFHSMSQFKPRYQLSPLSSSITLTQWDGTVNQKGKMRKPVGWDQENVIENSKICMPNKEKQGTYLPFPSFREVFSHLQENRAPSHIMVMLENKHYHADCCSPSQLLPSALYAEHHVIWSEISLWSIWVKCCLWVLSHFLVHPQSPHRWSGLR